MIAHTSFRKHSIDSWILRDFIEATVATVNYKNELSMIARFYNYRGPDLVRIVLAHLDILKPWLETKGYYFETDSYSYVTIAQTT